MVEKNHFNIADNDFFNHLVSSWVVHVFLSAKSLRLETAISLTARSRISNAGYAECSSWPLKPKGGNHEENEFVQAEKMD
jgi:hypothetical protein